MSNERVVECRDHGSQPATFVCQHIAATLATGVAVGFHWPESSDQEYPDAWCTSCHRRHEAAGWEWEGEAAEELGVTLLCAAGYGRCRALALGY